MGRVEGKVAIVTGAASGLGAADARILAGEGARVVLTDVDEPAGSALTKELDALFVRQDVSDEASWPALVAEVQQRYGRLGHLDGTFFGCRAAIPAMAAGGGGSIVNMSSTAGKTGIRCNSVHPGSIDTPMVHAALAGTRGIRLADAEDPEAGRRALGLGEPDHVANLVPYLASDESKHENGAELVIDAGDTVV